jgi:hypothetical protein
VWELLTITLLNGSEMHVAPRYIVSIIEARTADDPGKHYTDKVRCIITLIDNKIVTTEEECDSVEKRLRELTDKRIQEMRDGNDK